MTYNYFVLGYNAIEYFNSWYDKDQFKNTILRFVDNGNQNIPESLKDNIIHTNKKNVGCSGGWNLICDIGFKHFGFDKIIVGQEDGRVSEEIFDALLDSCNENTICGTYNNSFEFSTFAIHKSAFEKIGRFDENFVFVGCEDNDYKYRANLLGIEITTLGVSHAYNASIANNDNVKPKRASGHNAEYIDRKWGNYTYKQPFNGDTVQKYTDYFIELYGNLEEFPSETEFKLFKNNINGN
jgi:hypothetical protein